MDLPSNYMSKEYSNYIHIFHKRMTHRSKTLEVVGISDLHNKQWNLNLPSGDILAVAGDMTQTGNDEEFGDFTEFLSANKKKFDVIAVVAGNHDITLDKAFYTKNGHKHHDPVLDINKSRAFFTQNKDITYLEDEAAKYKKFNIYGTPWIPEIGPWAFTYENEEQEKSIFEKIPMNTDVLITHTPPKGIRDIYPMKHFEEDLETSQMMKSYIFTSMGSERLMERVKEVKPKVHIFGHIHYCYGWEEKDGTVFINASLMNRWSKPVNKPQKISILLEE